MTRRGPAHGRVNSPPLTGYQRALLGVGFVLFCVIVMIMFWAFGDIQKRKETQLSAQAQDKFLICKEVWEERLWTCEPYSE